MEEPTVDMCSISERRVERRRVKEEESAVRLEVMRCCLISAKRAGRGAASPPPRDAKTDDMSPSFRGPRSRCFVAVAAVASVRVVRRGRVRSGVVRWSVKSMLAVC